MASIFFVDAPFTQNCKDSLLSLHITQKQSQCQQVFVEAGDNSISCKADK